MFIGLLLIHRIITYVPTYSGGDYPEFHITYIILSILMICMSLQTKLGEKISILVDRVLELWDGESNNKNKNIKNTNVKVSQPISGQDTGVSGASYTDGTAISALPTYDIAHGNQSSIAPQQLPNYDAMYKQDTTPLVGAATPGGAESMSTIEPEAANSVLGGGAFGSW